MFRQNMAGLVDDLARTKALMKPPHPVSNIRPLLLQSVFAGPSQSKSHQSLAPSASANHPYSLSEIAIPSASVDLPPRLIRLRQQLAAQDVAFRLLVTRLERESQHFWVNMNTKFSAEKAVALRNGQDEDAFDRTWLATHSAEYQSFHARFLRGQYSALWPAFLVKLRQWKWKWACWRAGVPHGLR